MEWIRQFENFEINSLPWLPSVNDVVEIEENKSRDLDFQVETLLSSMKAVKTNIIIIAQ